MNNRFPTKADTVGVSGSIDVTPAIARFERQSTVTLAKRRLKKTWLLINMCTEVVVTTQML